LVISKGREEIAHFMLANYVIFAAIAPAMFGFGAAVAAEREAKLIELKQIAPLPAGGYLGRTPGGCLGSGRRPPSACWGRWPISGA
jgi:hypothetical protein